MDAHNKQQPQWRNERNVLVAYGEVGWAIYHHFYSIRGTSIEVWGRNYMFAVCFQNIIPREIIKLKMHITCLNDTPPALAFSPFPRSPRR